MSDDCCGGDGNDEDDNVSPRTVWLILGAVMLAGWGTLTVILLTR